MTEQPPNDPCQVRDLVRDVLQPHVDHQSSMDTGGGFGCADLWIWVGGREYLVTVKSSGATE